MASDALRALELALAARQARTLTTIKGEPGPQGPVGDRGSDGPQGPEGPRGQRGADGRDGAPGAEGPRGLRGERGAAGAPGPKGEQGRAGNDGPRGKQGPPGEGFTWRGRWERGTVYQPRDVVEHLGSAYVATRETTDTPGRNGSDWDLMAQRGQDGMGGGGGEPVDLSGYATLDGAETLSGKTLASPVVTGPLLPATAGQQALGSAAVPWGPVHASAPAGEESLTIAHRSRFRFGSHASAWLSSLDGSAALLLGNGIQVPGRFYLLGEMALHGRHMQPGPQISHSYCAGINGILAGQSSVTITTNMVSGTAAEIQITPRQLDPAIKTWAVTSVAGSFTVHVDAPASADWYFSWLITHRHLAQS